MSSREQILNRLREHNLAPTDMPDLGHLAKGPVVEPVETFKQAIESSAARCVILQKGQTVDEVVRELYPEAKVIASQMPEVTCTTLRIDQLEQAQGLEGVDVGVVRGVFGVAENGAIWIRQDVKHRGVYFISEALVIVVPHLEIVQNMHNAYQRIAQEEEDLKYGVFVAGPSKTADIEQALVIGAHGPRGVTVVLE